MAALPNPGYAYGYSTENAETAASTAADKINFFIGKPPLDGADFKTFWLILLKIFIQRHDISRLDFQISPPLSTNRI